MGLLLAGAHVTEAPRSTAFQSAPGHSVHKLLPIAAQHNVGAQAECIAVVLPENAKLRKAAADQQQEKEKGSHWSGTTVDD